MPEQEQEFYDEVYARGYDDSRYAGLRERVWQLAQGAGRVMDIGCGIGTLLGEWPEPKPFQRRGIDYSFKAVRLARTKFPRNQDNILQVDAAIWHEDLRTVRFDQQCADWFDAVTCLETIEHMDKDWRAWEICRFFARPEGIVIASVPNGTMKSKGHAHTYYDEETIREKFHGVQTVEVCGHWLIFTANGDGQHLCPPL